MPTSSEEEQTHHYYYLTQALNQARLSPPKPTNFRVGACLTTHEHNTLLSTGYTLELPGNTHAEQCCFLKLCARYGCAEEAALGEFLPPCVLYTTMEPCNRRSAGNVSCVERILRVGRRAIGRVVVGVREPGTFVGVNEGRARLEAAGIEVLVVEGLEAEILEVATAGHDNKGGGG